MSSNGRAPGEDKLEDPETAAAVGNGEVEFLTGEKKGGAGRGAPAYLIRPQHHRAVTRAWHCADLVELGN